MQEWHQSLDFLWIYCWPAVRLSSPNLSQQMDEEEHMGSATHMYVFLSVHFPKNCSRQTAGSVPPRKVLTASDRFWKTPVEGVLSARRVPRDTFSLVLRYLANPCSLQLELLQHSAVAVGQTSLKYASLNSIDL